MSNDSDYTEMLLQYYSNSAENIEDSILNPIDFEDEDLKFIPTKSSDRSYGCDTPVYNAGIRQGQTVVDLGCGSGIECFIASKLVGATGKVHGIDFSEEMLNIAQSSAKLFTKNTGLNNISFHKRFIDNTGLKENSADIVISNATINLVQNKEKVFEEIKRILKPEGKLCIADTVSEETIPTEIKDNEELICECIGGAMEQKDIMKLLDDAGFSSARIIKRTPYRKVNGYIFYSLIYEAWNALPKTSGKFIYRGPLASIVLNDGTIVKKGETITAKLDDILLTGDYFFHVDSAGYVTNSSNASSCCTFTPPPPQISTTKSQPNVSISERHNVDCMVCGANLVYSSVNKTATCYYCGKTASANAQCENGHYVCDKCHQKDGFDALLEMLLHSTETDMIKLFKRIRRHPSFAIHGPEYHSAVPGIVLATYRNLGGKINKEQIKTGIERGASIPGGACAFMGICGAASGVSTAFSIILEGTPLKPETRQKVMDLSSKILKEMSSFSAARCCQRDSWIALKTASKYSKELLPITLQAEEKLVCGQFKKNAECIKDECPIYPESLKK